MRRCLTSLDIREMQIKMPVRYFFTSSRLGTIKGNKCWWAYGKCESSYASGSDQFSRVQLSDPWTAACRASGVHHQLLEFTQTHVHWVGDAIQPSHPLSSPFPAFNLSQHQSLIWIIYTLLGLPLIKNPCVSVAGRAGLILTGGIRFCMLRGVAKN